MLKKINYISKILITLLAICVSLTGCVSSYNTQDSFCSEIMQSDIASVFEIKSIALPCDSYYCDGKQYAEIVAQFENAGFTNVKIVEQQGDNAKETRINGSVIAVTVNDNIIFSQGEIIDSNSEIKIYYVVSSITETTQQNDNTSSTVSEIQSDVTSTEQEQSIGIAPNINQSRVDSDSEPYSESENETISSNENTSSMVWISENGKRYHNKATCSGMKSPKKVTEEYAEEHGYEPCKRCYR